MYPDNYAIVGWRGCGQDFRVFLDLLEAGQVAVVHFEHEATEAGVLDQTAGMLACARTLPMADFDGLAIRPLDGILFDNLLPAEFEGELLVPGCERIEAVLNLACVM